MSHRPQVLLAEDDPAQQHALALLLEGAGHRVLRARNGAEALAFLDGHRVDAVVADGRMPFVDGYQLCRLLKDEARTAGLPVVLLTAAQEPLTRLWAHTCGADALLDKAEGFSALLPTLGALLAGRPPGPEDADLEAPEPLELGRLQERLGQALQRSLLEATLARAIHRLGDASRGPDEVASGFLELVGDLLLPGALRLHWPGARGGEGGDEAFVLRSRELPPELEAILAGPAKVRTVPGRAPEGLVHRPFPLEFPGGSGGLWEVWADPARLAAHGRLLQAATEAFAPVAASQALVRRLREAHDRQSELLRTLSHEVRSPLTAVQLCMDFMAQAPDPSDRHRRLMQETSGTIQRLLGSIAALLDLQKHEAGHWIVERRPFDVRAVAEEVVGTFRLLAQAQGVSMELPPGPPAEALGDPERFRGCLLNLLTNALKHTPSGGTVHLDVARSGDRVRASVADEGPGIPEAFRERVFGAFAQGGGRPGWGLGLAITKDLMEAMSGAIGFESTVGKGTAFWLELART
jgi:signal transduction histidine kinase